jgi:hypothetical protein
MPKRARTGPAKKRGRPCVSPDLGPLTKVVKVRFDPELMEFVRKAAAINHTSVSAFVRDALLDRASEIREQLQKRARKTGA